MKRTSNDIVQSVPNHYVPRAVHDLELNSLLDVVTFDSPDPERLPPPAPEFLALHAAAAKVANLSGAGEYALSLLRDMEDVKVLSTDGGSAPLLEAALECVVVY